ncbi:hypothetical protein AN618_21930 [Fervidicola ferrireducens]|uniref:Uncharacterized protein n=1 Tax=Fervidicola ferrireducens TaxID=520764 RepID=A0A140L288_9FIRM|nr:hypothetical protein [Fervidicola ferrireducens]KXG74663.1 hypothetical protein AN618_21930 [Fervidicola ferrireducens]
MGYTHYWYRPKTIHPATFRKIVADFKKLVPVLEEKYGVRLAGPGGEGDPIINDDEVSFNGPIHCGHQKNYELHIPWPSDDAGGVMIEGGGISGKWYAGVMVNTRMCNGDCSYESFVFERKRIPYGDWDVPRENGLYFDFCKTAFRPYDLAVTAFLIIAKHYLGDKIVVKSDGEDTHWFDAKLLCQMELSYGMEYKINDKGELIPVPSDGNKNVEKV